MAFYDLSKEERAGVVIAIHNEISGQLRTLEYKRITELFKDDDTYTRKAAYLSVGKIYFRHTEVQMNIIQILDILLKHENANVRQAVINAAGEIGKKSFEPVKHLFDIGLFDHHHSAKNAVIGCIKKMGEVNPLAVLPWARKYLHHPDKEIRREICHGIELRGRKHPQDILPILYELQYESTARVRTTLVHVLGQISYKKGCIQTVIGHLKNWENKALVADVLQEIIDVHARYRDFAALTQREAEEYIEAHI